MFTLEVVLNLPDGILRGHVDAVDTSQLWVWERKYGSGREQLLLGIYLFTETFSL